MYISSKSRQTSGIVQTHKKKNKRSIMQEFVADALLFKQVWHSVASKHTRYTKTDMVLSNFLDNDIDLCNFHYMPCMQTTCIMSALASIVYW